MPSKLIDRENEQRQLKELAANPPRLVILRGRRRVGKSFLLGQTLNSAKTVTFQADQQPLEEQLKLLAQEFSRFLPNNLPITFTDWNTAFTTIGEYATHTNFTLVIDEFQYLCENTPALPSIIQRHWDRWQRSDAKITLILCGSALSFMESLLSHSSPLYGRADYRPLLQPLDYRDAANFARAGLESTGLLRRYAVLGGTPQYQVWAGQGSVQSIIRNHILNKSASLYEEPLNLVREVTDIRNPGSYFSLLHGIANGHTTLSQLTNRFGGGASSNVLRLLNRLTELDYIELVRPLQAGKTPNRASYLIKDPFFRFWFKYVYPNRSQLEYHRLEPVLEKVMSDLDTYMGLAFEEFCRHWLRRYAEFPAAQESTEVGRWWARDGQDIDVVAMNKHNYLLLGSCKWRRIVGEDVLDQLYESCALLGGKAGRAQLALFARNGFTPKLQKRAQQENVLLFTANDLFK